ncbi:LOW QUALITY PROTEIN: espin [Lampetra planeri]
MDASSTTDKLMEAAKSGDLAALQTLLLLLPPPGGAARQRQDAVEGQEGPDEEEDRDAWTDSHHGATPAHYAARAGRLGALRYVVEEGGLPGHARALNGATPAHDAAATGHLACLQWLLTNGGCRPEDKDASGATVLHLAARFGRRSVVQWLLLQGSAGGGASDPLGVTASGALAVHYAAARGDLPTLQLLLAKAPQTLNSRTGAGATPLYLACQEGHLDCLQYLATECGAETSARASDGMTAMHAAAQMGHATVIVWLVSSTALRLSDTDADGATAMHFAASRGHGTVLSWLLLHGGEPTRDAWGGTPLHDAAENGHLQCCQILVVNGVDLRVRDNDGCSAADLAEHNGHARCAKYLRTVENMIPQLLQGLHATLKSPESRILAREYSMEGLATTDPDHPSAKSAAAAAAAAAADSSTFDPDAGTVTDQSGSRVDGSAVLRAYLDLLDPDEKVAVLASDRPDGGEGTAPAASRGARAERVNPVEVLQRRRSELRPVVTQESLGSAPDNVSAEELSQARLRRVDSSRKTRTFGKQPSTSDYYKSFSTERDEPLNASGSHMEPEPTPVLNGEDHSGEAETPESEMPEPEPPSSPVPEPLPAEDEEGPPAPPPPPPAPPAPPPPPPLPLPGELPRYSDGDHSRPPSAASSVKSFNMLSPNGDNSDLLAEIKAGRSLKPTHPSKGCTTVFIGSAHLNQRPTSPDYQPQGGAGTDGTNGDGGFSHGAVGGGGGGGSGSSGSSGVGAGGAGDSLSRLDSLDVDALVPLQDEQGRPIPEWKRQVMVRKLQTRLQQEEEQRRQVRKPSAFFCRRPVRPIRRARVFARCAVAWSDSGFAVFAAGRAVRRAEGAVVGARPAVGSGGAAVGVHRATNPGIKPRNPASVDPGSRSAPLGPVLLSLPRRKFEQYGFFQPESWTYSSNRNAMLGPFGELLTEKDIASLEKQIESLQLLKNVQEVETKLEVLEQEIHQMILPPTVEVADSRFATGADSVRALPGWCSRVSGLLRSMAFLVSSLGNKDIAGPEVGPAGAPPVAEARRGLENGGARSNGGGGGFGGAKWQRGPDDFAGDGGVGQESPRDEPCPVALEEARASEERKASTSVIRTQSFGSTREEVEWEIQQFGVSVKMLKSNFEPGAVKPAPVTRNGQGGGGGCGGGEEGRRAEAPPGEAAQPSGAEGPPRAPLLPVKSVDDDVCRLELGGELPSPPPSSEGGVATAATEATVRESVETRKVRTVLLFLGHWKKAVYSMSFGVKGDRRGGGLRHRRRSRRHVGVRGAGRGGRGVVDDGRGGARAHRGRAPPLLHEAAQVVNKLIGHWRLIIAHVPSRQIRHLSRAPAAYSPEQFLPHVNGRPPAYDSLTLDLFMLGYFQLLEMPMPRAERRARHLLCFEMFDRLASHPWETIRDFHRAVVAEVSGGRRDWRDGFEDAKRRFFGDAARRASAASSGGGSGRDRGDPAAAGADAVNWDSRRASEVSLPSYCGNTPAGDGEEQGGRCGARRRSDSVQVISELGEFSNDEICRYIDRSFSFWKEKEAELFDL